MISLFKHSEADGSSEMFYRLIALLFSSREYEKILALNEKLSSFQLTRETLAEYYLVCARCCIQLNDLRGFTQNLSHLQLSKEFSKYISFLIAERAFFSNDIKTALLEINKINFNEDEELKNISVLYEQRNSLLNGATITNRQILATLQTDPLYGYFLFVIRCYQSIDKLSPDFIEFNFSEAFLGNLSVPDKYIVLAQVFLIKGKLQEAATAVSYAKSMLPDSPYPDFLRLQINAETLHSFSTVEEQIEDFIKAHGIKKLKDFLKNITVRAKKANVETSIFKHLLQTKLNVASDDQAVLKLITQNSSRYTDYRQKSFLSSISARIYEKFGDIPNASTDYYDTGVEFYNNNDFPEAEKWFEKAYNISPALVKAGWYLSDSLYINSFTKIHPYIDERRVRKAIDVLNDCFKTLLNRRENLASNFSWVYLLMANLYERNGNIKDKDPKEEGRKAMAFIEFALLTNPTNLTRIKTATRLYSNIEMDMNATALSEKATSLNPDNKDLLEEFTRTVINRGDFNKAENLLPRLYELNPDSKEFYDGWKAFIQYIQSVDKPELINSSIELLKNKLKKDDKDLWTHSLLMHCYWVNNDEANSLEQADWIIGIESNDNYNYKNSELAFAYFLKNNVDKAIEYNNRITDENPGVYFDATCYYIASNKLGEAREAFEKLIVSHIAKFEIINDIRYYNIILDKAKSANSPYLVSIDELINDHVKGFIPRLRKKLKTDDFDIDPITEAKNFLEKPGYKENSWGRLALYVALFRLHIQQNNYTEALFCFNNVMNDSRSKFYSITWDNAATYISGSIDSVQSLPSVFRKVKEFEQKNMIPEAMQLIEDKVMDHLHDKLKTKNKILWQLPVLPIAVELQNDLIPASVLENSDTSNWILFTSYIPKLRSDIKNTYGIEIPGIRVRPLDYSLDNYGNAFNYQILLNEIPSVSGTVYIGYSFCPYANTKSLGTVGITPDATIISSFQLKNKGVWVKNEMLHILDKNKIDYWGEPIQYIMWHVQFMIESNLSIFLGAQHIENLLNEWKKKSYKDLVNKLFSEDTFNKKIRFGKILRALAEEKVPVTNVSAILNCCLESRLTSDDIYQDLENIRLSLKKFFIQKLERNAASVLELSPPLENDVSLWICSDNEKIFMQTSPEKVQEWLDDFRNLTSRNSSVEIITVRNKETRRFIKKMIELEYPQIEVMEHFPD